MTQNNLIQYLNDGLSQLHSEEETIDLVQRLRLNLYDMDKVNVDFENFLVWEV